MAKKKIDTSKIQLGKKRSVKKKTTPSPTAIDNDEVVKKIHKDETPINTTAESKSVEPPKEPTKRVTLDIPVSLHKRIKMHVFGLETTMKKYFLKLAEEDLEKE
jgi:hypothetical protein